MLLRELMANAASAVKSLITRKIEIEYLGIKLKFTDIPLSKILNMIVSEGSAKTLKPKKAYGLPTILQIESSSNCNLKCVACPVPRGFKRPTGLMDFDIFKKVIDEIGDYVFVIFFWDWGEPFLNPQAYDMIKYAKESGIKIISSTNGHLFYDIDSAQKLVNSGIDALLVSVDGITQNTYEKYRRGGDIEKIKMSVKNIVKSKVILNSKTPLVILQLIIMNHNENDMAGYEEFARSLGADAITFVKFNTYFDRSREAPLNDFLPLNNKLKRFIYNKENKEEKAVVKDCKTLWNTTNIHSSGNVVPCCYDPDEHHVLGNIRESTFRDIWNNERYTRLRLKVKGNDTGDLICDKTVCAYKKGKQRVISVKYLNA
ncbi:MAG: radical SAM protein [Nitrospirota bacterium]